MGSTIFCNSIFYEQLDYEIVLEKEKEPKQEKQVFSNEVELIEEKWCNMHFDGVVSKEGAGACISIVGPEFEYISFSYKLSFECTNNVVEYEALILGIKMIKKLEIKKLLFMEIQN